MDVLLLYVYEHPVLPSVLNSNVHTSLWPSSLFNRFVKERRRELAKKNLNQSELNVSNSMYKSLNVIRLLCKSL